MQTKLTRAEIMALSPQQLRLAVAELMGWKWQDASSNFPGWKSLKKSADDVYLGALITDKETHLYDILPNYSEDIAAAWTVHKKMAESRILSNAYLRHLQDVVLARLGLEYTTLLDMLMLLEPIDFCRAALMAQQAAEAVKEN